MPSDFKYFTSLVSSQAILMSGKPHLGTERLVKLLKNFRSKLTVCVRGIFVSD